MNHKNSDVPRSDLRRVGGKAAELCRGVSVLSCSRATERDALLQDFNNVPDTDAVVINDGAGGLRSTIVNFVTAVRAVRSGIRFIRAYGQPAESEVGVVGDDLRPHPNRHTRWKRPSARAKIPYPLTTSAPT